MELVDFLRARLDEDEQTAKAATPGPWWYNPRKQWLDPEAFEKYDLAKGEEFVGYGGPHPFTGAVCATGPASHSQSMVDAAHIARFADPARVLAEVEAKRALLNDYERAWTACANLSQGGIDLADVEEWKQRDQTVQALKPYLHGQARIHRTHPDFDPAWLES